MINSTGGNMFKLAGYKPFEQIYSGIRTSVYRAVRECDEQPVVIKLLRHEYPSFSELVQFRNQYAIAKSLDLPGVIKTYSLEAYQNSYALVMEDFGGVSLKDWSVRNAGTKSSAYFQDFFDIAIQIVTSLDDLYRNRVIHKDIKPANILVNPITKQVKLIDFSIASKLPKETQTLQYCNFLEGTLGYISPEQTGRMNRLVDWRSDFYSLGVTFFELLTGQLPFTSQDPMELVYSHIAKLPPLVHNINPDIPIILSEIIAKLMAKNAEDRYQSALGIKYDLEQANLIYQDETQIHKGFKLGQRDASDRFVIPEKLYGRETEVKTLLAAFERVANPHPSTSNTRRALEIVMVAGFSGIGKTAVVNEVHKPIVRQRGYFIKGKYDQFQRNVPFSGFLQAFRDLMEQLSSESDAQLTYWKTQILTALGSQAQVIIEFIPELERIIGSQPASTKLSGSPATNRFNLLFQKFIKVFACSLHPLVIFLDDLQWADSASLKLMQSLVNSDIQHLFLIGAYRDNEVSAAHPLLLTLEEIKKDNILISTIVLKPLSTDNLTHLVRDTLNCSFENAAALTNIIYQKTQGNPFFSNQFFKSLYDDGLISFNKDEYHLHKSGGWECNFSRIKELAFTDNVVEFMALQLQKLPLATQSALKLAACIGNQFDLLTLAIVNDKNQAETAVDLWKALQEGLIIPTNEIYKLYQDNFANEEKLSVVNKHSVVTYKFIHDRVQQAAYSLIPEEQKQSTHLNIGQLLLNNTPIDKQEDKIFDIVNQLNYGVDLITIPEQLLELAQLNLNAGRKAKASTAHVAAARYFDVALEILGDSCWHQYELALALYEEACDAAYLCGDFENMKKFAQQVISQAKTIIDRIRVYEIKIQACVAQNQLIEGLNISLDVLRLLNIEFPKTPKELDIQQAFQTTAALLIGRDIADLINLPEMTDPENLAAMRILSSMFSAAYLGSPEFVPLVTLKMVDLSIKYGNTGLSANGYCTYGFLLCCVIGDIDAGYEFAQLSLNLLSQTSIASLQAKTLLLYNSLVGHWKNHARDFLKPLQEVYRIGLETGDLEFASYALHNYSFGSYLTGQELIGLEEEMSVYCETLKQLKQKTGLGYIKIWHQTILNLMNKSDDVCSLVGTAYDEQVMLPQHQEMNDITAICMVYFNKCTLNYLFNNSDIALDYAMKAEKYLSGLTGLIIFPAFYYYDSLVRLAVYLDTAPAFQNEILEKVRSNQEKMQHWANHAPMNFLHKHYLVEAEIHRVLDNKLAAMECYEQAIKLAQQNDYLQEEALAQELAAKFYLGWNQNTIAQTYLINAYYCYARWGASAKLQDLEKQYPHLLTSIKERKTNFNSYETIAISNSTSFTITETTSRISNSLDLLSLVKASQAISSEMELEKLLVSLMQVLIENAGASKAVLILPSSGKLVVEAVGLSTKIVKSLLESIPIEESQEIPVNLINYVSRSKEHVIFNNTILENTNYKDEYVFQQKPQSILCNPILNQGKLVAILYLENDLATGVFTESRLNFIKLLCSQIAISLENARLYQQSQDYAQKLELSLENLKQAQLQLIQSEKMTALGNLVAGIGHEINNPINFLTGNLQPAREYVQNLLELIDLYQNYYPNPVAQIAEEIKDIDFSYIREDFPKVIESMQQAVDRIYEISISLRTFSRADTHKKVLFNIHEGIDSTLMLLKHRLKASEGRPNIKVVTNYDDLPQVKGFPGQLNQVFMNLIANAIDALEESNAERSFNEITQSPLQITIFTSLNSDKSHVLITIRDNGIGMTPEVKAKIFDHLFTTKSVGKGTGLGLTIVRQIVEEKHGGTIEVNSTIGEGTAFVISIPV
ncbi:serine/threonine protein kinase with two-component sensor domain [Calothrix sp. NIES-4071]|nr:serine/threonine protein kinase with two-component sensor domain [Calothrix sp. NIES-4071]BAZ58186.1 serine/threonine protein kinase with two-component sensor domain [Calothrix sp. NIES-4105]